MEISFKQKNEKYIEIYMKDVDKKEEFLVGHIFTPSGSGETNVNAIQICGFDEAFDLWGCGVFGDEKTKQMKKDIQLCWFRPYKKMSSDATRTVVVKGEVDYVTEEVAKKLKINPGLRESTKKVDRFASFDKEDGICHKCFNYPCNCEIKTNYENPFTVKREQDLHNVLINKKDYEEMLKAKMIQKLKE